MEGCQGRAALGGGKQTGLLGIIALNINLYNYTKSSANINLIEIDTYMHNATLSVVYT